MQIEPMDLEQAQLILDNAKAALTKTVPPQWAALLHAMQRRLDYENSRKEAFKQIAPCRFAEKQADLFAPNRPCKGYKVICSNPENAINDWYESGCRPEKCKFYKEATQ